jgi:hypothetical protein
VRLSKLIPSSILRRIDRARERRILAVTEPATVEFVRRNGLRVLHGPFAGMNYLEGLESTVGDLIVKLTGLYEHELHGAVEEWIEAGFEHVIDIGGAEGYYAVGFAVKMPATTVHAFDINPDQRARCTAMAGLNRVEDRVEVKGECSAASFASFPEHGVALLSDCEGAELMLLDPELAPRLRGWPILVELHDFIDPSITATICQRFEATHEIELIDSAPQGATVPQEMEFATDRQRAVLLSERPAGMRWAHMRPRLQQA